MHYTLEQLVQGNADIARYYQAAKEKWDELFEKHAADSVAEWAKWVSTQQLPFFERVCGGRGLGQEIMAWSGFAALYTTAAGFEDNLGTAKKLADAFATSTCSPEVKGRAEQAATAYGVLED